MKHQVILILACVVLSMCVTDSSPTSHATVSRQSEGGTVEQIQVVHFHRVHQCTCCINVGKWAEETIQTHFPAEYEQGTIVYMDLCIEEQPEMARKFNAYGSSLFINVIRRGEEEITENMEVWTYCFDHDAYIDYFRSFLDQILTT